MSEYFQPAKAFSNTVYDFKNLTQAFVNGNLDKDKYLVVAKQAHDTLWALYSATFWSMFLPLKDHFLEEQDVQNLASKISEELYRNPNREELETRMHRLIDNAMKDFGAN